MGAPFAAPLVMGPRASGDASLLLVASTSGQQVMAPEAGTVVYVGPGDEKPWTGNAPGAMVIVGRRRTSTGPRYLHVLGFLDPDHLRTAWQLGRDAWGYTEPARAGITTGGLIDHWTSRNTAPRPTVEADELVARIAPSSPGVRWTIWQMGSDWDDLWTDLRVMASQHASPDDLGDELLSAMDERGWKLVDPLAWLADRGLPRPTMYRPPAGPAPAPAPSAPPPAADGGSWLWLALAGGALWWLGRRKERTTRRQRR
jgi:hypothetical protein